MGTYAVGSAASSSGGVEMPSQLTEAELEVLIEETERKMLGLPEPTNVDAFKAGPDPDLPSRALKPGDKELRAFILTHSRAPTAQELGAMMRRR